MKKFIEQIDNIILAFNTKYPWAEDMAMCSWVGGFLLALTIFETFRASLENILAHVPFGVLALIYCMGIVLTTFFCYPFTIWGNGGNSDGAGQLAILIGFAWGLVVPILLATAFVWVTFIALAILFEELFRRAWESILETERDVGEDTPQQEPQWEKFGR